jgi:dimeric dUTPase (all-alpha-NTP-PPase superfamily)
MFRLQRELNIRCGCPLDRLLTTEEMNDWLLKFCRADLHETIELEDSCMWKHWKKNQPFDLQNIRVEIVDKLHFLISLAQVAGMSADDLFEAYLKKNQVNHQRQDSGYVVKDENDCRHI